MVSEKEQKLPSENGKEEVKKKDNIKSIKSPQKPPATDAASYKSPTRNDKSNSSDEDNNLSGLIMSDGLVGEREKANLILN